MPSDEVRSTTKLSSTGVESIEKECSRKQHFKELKGKVEIEQSKGVHKTSICARSWKRGSAVVEAQVKKKVLRKQSIDRSNLERYR